MIQDAFRPLIGESPCMQELRNLIERVSQHTYPVLILGESGTGKEVVARAIHQLGPRGKVQFAPVDCAALTSTLIETELFGHTRGAFTGADQTRRGLFEAADGGTLFLDEIGELAVEMQAKLLRAMQEKEIRPVGSTVRLPVNVRVIAATNRDLEADVRNGKFRQDLYFRLNVMEIKLPPLRERKTDISLLVEHFLEKHAGSEGFVRTISDVGLRRLLGYDWPGNIRELENAIERAVALSSRGVLGADDFPLTLADVTGQPLPGEHEFMPLDEIERRAILHALRDTDGDKIATARLLGIGKTTLYRKLKQYEQGS